MRLSKKPKIIIGGIVFFILLLSSFIVGLWWFAIGITIILLCYLFFASTLKIALFIRTNTFIRIPVVITGFFVLAILIKVFLFEIYAIPSNSMRDTLKQGDKILVSKFNYGPRMPESPYEISWVNLFFYLHRKSRDRINEKWWSYRRLSGHKSLSRGDIVVFNFPGDPRTLLIKRCIGLPGDTIRIKDGNVFAGTKRLVPSKDVRFTYRVYINDQKSLYSLFDSLKIIDYVPIIPDNKNSCVINMSVTNMKILKVSECVDSINLFISDAGALQGTDQWKVSKLWTIDNFGPVFIPAKGSTIKLSDLSLDLYGWIIRVYENCDIEEIDGRYLKNGIEMTEYIFKQDYFFMMGDNRSFSYDSRVWGFVPEESIVGEGVLVLFSRNKESFKWERILKVL